MQKDSERIIEEHQVELKRWLQEHGVQKYADAEVTEFAESGPVFRNFKAYKCRGASTRVLTP